MAGLGRKVFASGDILLASEVQGFLQDQAVMVFDDDAARTAAIATPTEGMVTFRKDDNALEVFDGSVFAPVGSEPGLVHIESRTLTAVSGESFDNVFSAAFDNYRILFESSKSAGSGISIRFRVGGVDNSGANYQAVSLQNDQTSIFTTRQINATSAFFLRNSGLAETSSIMSYDFYNPFTNLRTSCSGDGANGEFSLSLYNQIQHHTTTSFDGFSLLVNTGTITSKISIYGYAKA